MALVSIGVFFVLTLTATTINSNRLFVVYVNIFMICLLVGLIMFAYWLKTRSSVSHTVAEIKSRMIVATPVQQVPPVDSTSG